MDKKDYWFDEVRKERARQDEKWGRQDHHPLLWFSIIGEEYGEMCQAFNNYLIERDYSHLDGMKREAVQVAACCIAMLECLERKTDEGFLPD